MIGSAGGAPYETMAVPGRDLGLQLLLGRNDAGEGVLVVLPYRIVGTNPDGTDQVQNFDAVRLQPGDEKVSDALGVSVALADFGEYTLLIAKRDPGQGIVWAAFLSPDRRDHDHVLSTAAPGLGPRRAGRPARHRLPRRPLCRRRARVRRDARRSRRGPSTRAGVTTLHELHRALFPTARPIGVGRAGAGACRVARSDGSASSSHASRHSRRSRPAISRSSRGRRWRWSRRAPRRSTT